VLGIFGNWASDVWELRKLGGTGHRRPELLVYAQALFSDCCRVLLTLGLLPSQDGHQPCRFW
jgi:hypothetical protein